MLLSQADVYLNAHSNMIVFCASLLLNIHSFLIILENLFLCYIPMLRSTLMGLPSIATLYFLYGSDT